MSLKNLNSLRRLIQDILAGNPTEADLQALVSAFQANQVVITFGERAVSVDGKISMVCDLAERRLQRVIQPAQLVPFSRELHRKHRQQLTLKGFEMH